MRSGRESAGFALRVSPLLLPIQLAMTISNDWPLHYTTSHWLRPVPALQLACLHNGASTPLRHLPNYLPQKGARLSFPAAARLPLMSRSFTLFKAGEMHTLSRSEE